MPSSYWVYILKCSDGSLYTGMTNNLPRRLGLHAAGHGSKYVYSRRPFELVWIEPSASRSLALKREWQIKQMPRPKKAVLVQRTSRRRLKLFKSMK